MPATAKTCPVCDSEAVVANGWGGCWVHCTGCGMRGPADPESRERIAITSWNHIYFDANKTRGPQ